MVKAATTSCTSASTVLVLCSILSSSSSIVLFFACSCSCLQCIHYILASTSHIQEPFSHHHHPLIHQRHRALLPFSCIQHLESGPVYLDSRNILRQSRCTSTSAVACRRTASVSEAAPAAVLEEAEAPGERGAAGCLILLDDGDLLLDLLLVVLAAAVVCDLLLILSF